MSDDILPIPGSWNDSWESPITTTQNREGPVRVPHVAPLPPARRIFRGTRDKDYKPFGFPKHPTAQVLEDSPSSQRYALFGDTSDTEGNSDAAEEDKPPIVIAVFGQTGTGKTSFVKSVTGNELQVGHGLTSCTEDVLAVPCKIGNKNIMLVDTPGFSDTNYSDTEILRRIAAWMKDTYDDGYLLSGIIYLHRIIDTRMQGPSLKNLRMMKALCGANTLRNVVLATTMWEKVTEEEGLMREAELKRDFWKDMIDGGSTVRRITTETGDDARALVKSLLKNKPISTRLQEELHSGKSLVQTEAGTEIREEMKRLEQKLKAEHEAEMTELKEAQRDRDIDLVRRIRAEMAQNSLRIAQLEAEKKELENSTLKVLPKAKREGLFGWGSYRCLVCGRKTTRFGRWKCKSCHHEQSNVW